MSSLLSPWSLTSLNFNKWRPFSLPHPSSMALWLGIRPHFLSLMFLWLLCLCLCFATCYLMQNVNNQECGPFTPNASQHRTAGAPFKKSTLRIPWPEPYCEVTLQLSVTREVMVIDEFSWLFICCLGPLQPCKAVKHCRSLPSWCARVVESLVVLFNAAAQTEALQAWKWRELQIWKCNSC